MDGLIFLNYMSMSCYQQDLILLSTISNDDQSMIDRYSKSECIFVVSTVFEGGQSVYQVILVRDAPRFTPGFPKIKSDNDNGFFTPSRFLFN